MENPLSIEMQYEEPRLITKYTSGYGYFEIRRWSARRGHTDYHIERWPDDVFRFRVNDNARRVPCAEHMAIRFHYNLPFVWQSGGYRVLKGR